MHLDILGTSLATAFALLIANIGAFYMIIKVTTCGLHNFCKMLAFPMINVVVMISTILIMKEYLINSVRITEFILFILLSILIYFGIGYLLDKFFKYGIRSLIKESIASL